MVSTLTRGVATGARDTAARGSFVDALHASVAALAQLVRPTATVFYWVGENHEPSDFELFGMPEAMHRAYLQRYCTLDPLHPSRFAVDGPSVMTLARELPERVRSSSIYWRRFLNPHQVVDVLEVPLRDGERTVTGFSLLRMSPAEAFCAADLGRAQAVQALLCAALVPLLNKEQPMRTLMEVSRRLTHREQQIARLICNGLSNKAIARQLGLAQPTVKTHLMRMFRKVGVSSRTELIGALFL